MTSNVNVSLSQRLQIGIANLLPAYFALVMATGIIAIATWVVRLIARFSLRDTLEEHYNTVEPLGLRLSAVMTFFFGGIYFQYKLNRINEVKIALRYQGAIR